MSNAVEAYDRYGEHRLAELRARAGLVDVRERRDPTAATQSLAWVSPGQPMQAEWDAETAIRWAFYANVIVYRCVQIRANTIASLPFLAGLHPPKQPGRAGIVSEGARLQQLLGPPPGGPAPKLSARRLWAWTVAQRIVTGKHGWEIETDQGGAIAALWPLTSAKLRAIPSTRGADWFSRFEYGLEHDPRRLAADQVVYGWNPSMHDFRQPESSLQAARLDVSIAVMSDRYAYAFLRNDARPAAVVVTEQFATDDEYTAFKSQFRYEYGGPDNANKTAFVEATGEEGAKGAIDIKVLGLSQKDAQFMQQHVASLQRIAIGLGVPWSKLDASGRTFDNAGEEDHSWWESTILPDLADFADEVNMQLAPRLGREVGWFDTSGVRALQAPKQVASVGAPSLLQSMLTTYDEARGLVGLDPLPGGAGNRFPTVEELAVLRGTIPIDQPVTPSAPALPPAQVEAPAPAANAEPQREVKPEVRYSDDPDIRRTKVWIATDAIVRALEHRWERQMRRLFARQEQATIARLEGKRGRQALRGEQRAPEGVFEPDHWRRETEDLAQELYDAVLAAGAARIGDRFGVDFDLEAEWAQAFVRARANQLAGVVTDTTYRAIRDQLADGIAAGEDVGQLAARVRHVFDVASTSRATTIARTEVISAFNGSATLTASQLPADVVGGREWIATRDIRTRGEHGDADGQVVAIDAPFAVGGDALMYPGDPSGAPDNIINCRCTVAFLSQKEMAARAARVEKRARVEDLAPLLALVAGRHIDDLALRRAYREVAA